jgi:hypothetical protein
MSEAHVRTTTRNISTIVIGIAAAMLLIAGASPVHAQTQYVIGNFCSTCMETGPHNQLYDDGLHGDGAAGDRIWGADIVSDVPAGSFFFYFGSTFGDIQFPRTQPCAPVSATLWTSTPGETIHFQSGGAHTDGGGVTGWFPSWAGSSDHSIPAGAVLDFVLLSPAAPPGGWRCRATKDGTMWSGVWRAPAELLDGAGGTYYVLATPGYRFHESYNGGCFWELLEMPVYWNAPAGQLVLFQFDEATGQFRNSIAGPTPTRRSSWGELKTHYR